MVFLTVFLLYQMKLCALNHFLLCHSVLPCGVICSIINHFLLYPVVLYVVFFRTSCYIIMLCLFNCRVNRKTGLTSVVVICQMALEIGFVVSLVRETSGGENWK